VEAPPTFNFRGERGCFGSGGGSSGGPRLCVPAQLEFESKI